MTGTKGQDRLDRLERMAEARFPGISALKASQAIQLMFFSPVSDMYWQRLVS
ncbi:MAG: hypothetical protein R6X27_14275 [Candidatus Desulfacyla sp.]